MKYFCISNISSSGALGVSNSQIRTCSIFNMRAISYLAMLAFQLYQLLVFSIILQPPTLQSEGKYQTISMFFLALMRLLPTWNQYRRLLLAVPCSI